MSPRTRGALIVVEGIDRTGKSTQCSLLEKTLKAKNISTKLMKFPDRTTAIGKMIDSYLKRTCDLDDHAIHLLFSANRWEVSQSIKNDLLSGVTLIIDRYAFSGVAYSGAKPSMDLQWCKQSDIGLPKPDAVLFLHLDPDETQRRSGYGDERYENNDFQERVYKNFESLFDSEYWKAIDASGTVQAVHENIVSIVEETIGSVQHTEIKQLWNSNSPGI